ncbi:DUF3021 family protein [Kineothrix sedimenti]|uniref:DUF3021 family protein n=1 Tax=Kineothrix sedimenti TaxID=3123317 RepID=A0ABZ3EZF9_9FIRM
MKRYIQSSLQLSSIIIIVVTFISFLCFDYTQDMKFIFQIVLIAFLGMAVHYAVAYIFYDSFLKELICEYIVIEITVLIVGCINGWFIRSNWWMSFIYITPIFLLAYLLGITHIKKEILSINKKLKEKAGVPDEENK